MEEPCLSKFLTLSLPITPIKYSAKDVFWGILRNFKMPHSVEHLSKATLMFYRN